MTATPTYLVTGAGGGVGGVGRIVVDELLASGQTVRAMVHREDDRAEALRESGAHVVAGDLTDPVAVADALDGMSQMTVSQMTPTSTAESHQQRLHWLAEHVIDWSPIPAVQIRPTVFLENPLFTILAARSIREQQVLALPFGSGRTSPIAAGDVADAVTAVLRDPAGHIGAVYELTGSVILDVDGLAAQYGSALGREISGQRLDFDEWRSELEDSGLDPHVQEHITTMARLHREDRYNRSTDQVQALTGHAPQSVEDFVRAHRDLFA
jgi:uncharacterized protein YbjT (DUF2867 family)